MEKKSSAEEREENVFVPPPPPSAAFPPPPKQQHISNDRNYFDKTAESVIPPPPPKYGSKKLKPAVLPFEREVPLPPHQLSIEASAKIRKDRPPENIAADYSKVSIIRRYFAYCFDSIFALIPLFVVLFFSPVKNELEIMYGNYMRFGTIYIFDEERFGVILIILTAMLLLAVTYMIIRDGIGKGRSWGKRMTGLMVVSLRTEKPCGRGRSFLRNFLCLIPGINILYTVVEVIMVSANPKGRRIGDYIAGTQVITASEYKV
ncbi:RDD family protein [Phosphitispora sp. TUW77]|uniref:RDD family protein n=1 Tax=Phosphitispora sp. TUW77 TaxID=3152361 RepID=UPI003AB7EB37